MELTANLNPTACLLAAAQTSAGAEHRDSRKSKPKQRIWHNLSRLPLRTLASARRLLSPAYKLERAADRVVPRTFAAERLRGLEKIPGTSSARECRLLAYLVLQSPASGAIVEIGAFKGKSTAWLVEAAERSSRKPTIVSIDPHIGDASWHPDPTWLPFRRTVDEWDLERRGLEVLRASSHDVGAAWRRPISLLWIDGSHNYEDVQLDIAQFTPYVVPGGWVIFDDAEGDHFPGVARAIREWDASQAAFKNVGLIRHLAVFRRAEPRRTTERL